MIAPPTYLKIHERPNITNSGFGEKLGTAPHVLAHTTTKTCTGIRAGSAGTMNAAMSNMSDSGRRRRRDGR